MATYSQLRNIDPDDEAQLLDTIEDRKSVV